MVLVLLMIATPMVSFAGSKFSEYTYLKEKHKKWEKTPWNWPEVHWVLTGNHGVIITQAQQLNKPQDTWFCWSNTFFITPTRICNHNSFLWFSSLFAAGSTNELCANSVSCNILYHVIWIPAVFAIMCVLLAVYIFRLSNLIFYLNKKCLHCSQ